MQKYEKFFVNNSFLRYFFLTLISHLIFDFRLAGTLSAEKCKNIDVFVMS